MNFGVVGSAGMEGVDIDGYILPDASHIVTDGKNEIGRRAIDYAARRKISCKIETNKRKLMADVTISELAQNAEKSAFSSLSVLTYVSMPATLRLEKSRFFRRY